MNRAYEILSRINEIIINPIIVLLFSVALLYFLYGVFEYIWKSKSDPAKMKEGRAHMGWGLFGMFVMVSVFGFFRFILNTIPVGDRSRDNVNRVLNIE